jgi:hypothetical protein
VERQVGDDWVTFADQSGEVPVTLKYPESSQGTVDPGAIAQGLIGGRTGGQEWKWTASFEAFVSRFPLVDMQGNDYTATPAGTYRFVVKGAWRKGNADTPYTRISNPFDVKPWSGITVEGAQTDSAGHVTFAAGPSHQLQETTVRHTARPALAPGNAPITFTIGPVDFPDMAKDPKATGARFLNGTRGYSGSSLTNLEHYCLDCSFRPWLDATGQLSALVTIDRATGKSVTERVHPGADGSFRTTAALKPGDTASIAIEDAWGDTTAAPAAVSG